MLSNDSKDQNTGLSNENLSVLSDIEVLQDTMESDDYPQ